MAKSILIVDDVQMFIDIYKEFLQYTKVEVMTAKNGIEALDVMKANKPDLIFMDLQMPRMDGAACCRIIKTDPILMDIPVIMISSTIKDEDRQISLTAGCDHFMSKPVSRDTFLDSARNILRDIDRREKRVSCSLDGTFIIDNKTVPFKILNISNGGAYIACDYRMIPDDVIQIGFVISDGKKIECHARVAWVNRIHTKIPQGFGVKFALLDKNAIEALKNFITNKK
jgi:CheY-like chemotaxis protein